MLLATAITLVGCRATPIAQGSHHQIIATFQYRQLRADLPPSIRIPAVIAAAQAVLLDRGYSIRESTATEDHGEVHGEPHDADLLESISIDVRQTNTANRIRIIAEPTGNQARSRAILDAILQKVGI